MTMPTTSTWVDILMPTQCPCCGQAVMPTPQDYLTAFTTSMDQFTTSVSQWMGGTGGMPTRTAAPATAGTVTYRSSPARTAMPGPPSWSGAPMYGWGRQQPAPSSYSHDTHGHQHHAGCGCGGHDHGGTCGCCSGIKHSGACRQDNCHCQCCIGDDLDLVVYSRLGERRIVPITVTNERRREREVTLDLSGFKSKGGRAVPVTGTILGASTFTLAPCEEKAVTIVVESTEIADEREGEGTDVDDCVVAVADLRVEGCDIRCPIGIGVVLLPRECDTFDLECGCGCC